MLAWHLKKIVTVPLASIGKWASDTAMVVVQVGVCGDAPAQHEDRHLFLDLNCFQEYTAMRNLVQIIGCSPSHVYCWWVWEFSNSSKLFRYFYLSDLCTLFVLFISTLFILFIVLIINLFIYKLFIVLIYVLYFHVTDIGMRSWKNNVLPKTMDSGEICTGDFLSHIFSYYNIPALYNHHHFLICKKSP